MKRLLVLLLTAGLVACAGTPRETPQPQKLGDVIGVSEAMLQVDYWLARTGQPDQELMSRAEIESFSAEALAIDPTMTDLGELPASLPAAALRERILAMSSRPQRELVYPDGRPVGDADWQRYAASLNLDGVAADNPLHFGLVLRRTPMRKFPTMDRVLRHVDDPHLDRFQENGLFPGNALALLHRSADGRWWFAQSYNYAAWVRADDVAVGSRAQVLDYRSAEPSIVVTGSTVRTNFNPDLPPLSELQLDMGVRLPAVPREEVGHSVHGQNPYASHVVRLPLRNADGRLDFAPALIAYSRDVHEGPLPLTRANLLRQAFKFLGERYGWGHDYNGRDCTGFVGEVYRSFGILLPRNSGDQGRSFLGSNTRFADDTPIAAKERYLADLDVGDLLYIPGHVMLVIGHVDGEPYVMHDVTGLSYYDGDGNFYQGLLHGVAVTPLRPLQHTAEQSFVDRIYAIKRIR